MGFRMGEQSKNHRVDRVEIGWILAGRLSESYEHLLQEARLQFVATMQSHFPAFDWNISVIKRPDIGVQKLVNPVVFLENGVRERDRHHWDLATVFTSSEIVSTKASAFGVISRALDTGVISLSCMSHIAEDGVRANVGPEAFRKRIVAIVAHYFGHFVGLEHGDDPGSFMWSIRGPSDLDSMEGFTEDEVARALTGLQALADPRLEETPKRLSLLSFYLQSIWVNRRDIGDAVTQARPWQFPLRLGRLTAAAISTLLIMLMTAEVWDLAFSQTAERMLLLSFIVVLIATFYVLHKQNLVIYKNRSHMTEQMVTTGFSTWLVVFLGMLTTYLLLFGISALAAGLLFSDDLVSAWVGETDFEVRLHHYVTLSSFVGSMGLAIGSLGASIEPQEAFRFVTYVDEEL
jgi:hypothetical protein